MSYFGANRMGTYRPTKETYPLMEALAVAVAVDRDQGFIKSGQGYYDTEREVAINDNRSVALTTLRVMNDKLKEVDSEGNRLHVVRPEQEDYDRAQEIFSYFDQVLLMDKMGDNLVKQGADGVVNDYNLQLSQMFDRAEVDINKELAMLVSLPNSRRIADKREQMEAFYAAHRENGYIGELRQRLKLAGRVMDVKFIPRHAIHLATVMTEEGKLAKFFMNDKLSDIAKSINGKDIVFTGTVKKQEINSHTRCQETVFNRVKIETQA